MFVEDLDSFYADGRLHFGDAAILERAKGWHEKWGADPNAGWSSDVNTTCAEEV